MWAGEQRAIGELMIEMNNQSTSCIGYAKFLSQLDNHQEVLFSDTVGFIRDLPPSLEMAFKATLEELYSADVLLHVVDASDPQAQKQIQSVLTILTEMDLIGKPRVLVFNKIDLLRPEIASNLCNLHNAIGVSALERGSTRPLLDRLQYELDLELADWVDQNQNGWDSVEVHSEEEEIQFDDDQEQSTSHESTLDAYEPSIDHTQLASDLGDFISNPESLQNQTPSTQADQEEDIEPSSTEATVDESSPQALLNRVLSPDQSTWTDIDWLAYSAQYELRQEAQQRRELEKQQRKKKKKDDEDEDWWS